MSGPFTVCDRGPWSMAKDLQAFLSLPVSEGTIDWTNHGPSQDAHGHELYLENT